MSDEVTKEMRDALIDVIIESRSYKCPHCVDGWEKQTCRKCGGKGILQEDGSKCPICRGSGKYVYKKTLKFSGKKCKYCEGSGKKIKMPPRF